MSKHRRSLSPLLLLLLCFVDEATAFTVPLRSNKIISTSKISSSRLSSLLKSNSDGTVSAVHSLSTKTKLIEEAKRINSTKGSYSAVSWSNRLGSVLTPSSVPGVYTADRPFYWNKIDVGGRMTVIKLQNGDLIVHSPIGVDPPLIRSLDELGEVKHVISPNYEHVKYAKQWAEQYPDAKMWGCPGLMERKPDVRWTGEIPFGARPPGFLGSQSKGKDNEEQWDWNEFQPLHIDTEVNPFTGKSFFNEVIFYHSPSKTLFVTDIYWNYPNLDGITNSQIWDELPSVDVQTRNEDFGTWELAPSVDKVPFGSTAWKFGMDKIYYPFYMNLMIAKDKRQAFNDIGRFITGNGWEVETIIPCHGDIIRGKAVCKQVLEKHFQVQCSLPTIDEHFTSTSTTSWLKKMAVSYELEKGEDLLEVISREAGDPAKKVDYDNLMQLATTCALSPFPIASHDFLRAGAAEPIYNYGNNAFLNGFGYPYDEFVELPSRKCVETDAQVEERQKLLNDVKDAVTSKSQANNAADRYDNLIRVRKDGKKIMLKGVHLWNVYDVSESSDANRAKIESGSIEAIGQAVWIRNVINLD